MHPRRCKLSEALAREIEEGVAEGRWRGWLPKEREFATELRVSRSTLRKALTLLRENGVIESLRSKGHRILIDSPREEISKRRTVVLLTPGAIDQDRPLISFPFYEFRKELEDEQCSLKVVESRACYSGQPGKALEKLVDRHKADCWILRLSTQQMQEWFSQENVPAVVLGSCYAGVALPFVDIDWRALTRHALGVMVRAGHRRVALLISRKEHGGDVESAKGFEDAVEDMRAFHTDLDGTVVRYRESVEGVVHGLDRLLAHADRPTAILVAQPTFYLTVASELARRGFRIPEDVSLLSQSEATFMDYVLPRPSCYEVNKNEFARELLVCIESVFNHAALQASLEHRILPSYKKGDSLGVSAG